MGERFDEYKRAYREIAEHDRKVIEDRREFADCLAMLSEEDAAKELEKLRLAMRDACLAGFPERLEEYKEACERLREKAQ